jgi:hypothetical protein
VVKAQAVSVLARKISELAREDVAAHDPGDQGESPRADKAEYDQRDRVTRGVYPPPEQGVLRNAGLNLEHGSKRKRGEQADEGQGLRRALRAQLRRFDAANGAHASGLIRRDDSRP